AKAQQSLASGLDEVQAETKQFPQFAQQFSDIEKALKALDSVDKQAQGAIASSDQKFNSAEVKAAKGKGERERQAYNSTKDSLKQLVPGALAKLVAQKFSNASSITQPLSQQQQELARDLQNKVSDFERATKDTPPPPIDHGNEHNVDS